MQKFSTGVTPYRTTMYRLNQKIKEDALMEDLISLLRKLAQARDISGLKAYEQ